MRSSLGQMTSRYVHVDLLSRTQALDRWLPEMFMQTYCHALKPWTDGFQKCSCRPIVMHSSLGQNDFQKCSCRLIVMHSSLGQNDFQKCSCRSIVMHSSLGQNGFQKYSCRPIVMQSSLGQMTSRNVHVDLLSCTQALDRWLPEMFM